MRPLPQEQDEVWDSTAPHRGILCRKINSNAEKGHVLAIRKGYLVSSVLNCNLVYYGAKRLCALAVLLPGLLRMVLRFPRLHAFMICFDQDHTSHVVWKDLSG